MWLQFGDVEQKTRVMRQADGAARRRGRLESLREKVKGLRAGEIASRCRCHRFPWEHGDADDCGPRNTYRRARLAKLYRFRLQGLSIAAVNKLLREINPRL